MDNAWKLTTIGLLAVILTALATALATAYFMGQRTTEPGALSTVSAPAPMTFAPASAAPTRAAIGSAAAPVPRRAIARRVEQPGRYVPAAATAAPATGCDANAKIVRVAKDGLVGGVLGAAVGAGAGAIADGGRAAGKGAAIGGMTGAVAGALYGLHGNKTACGSAWR